MPPPGLPGRRNPNTPAEAVSPDVVQIRARSRRDLLKMVASPEFLAGVPHKWASLGKTVVVPSRLLLLVDLRTLVPLLLLVFYALAGGLEVGSFWAAAAAR